MTPTGPQDPRRLRVLALFALLLVAAAVADRLPRPSRQGSDRVTRAAMPVAAPEGSLSSTFFCGGASGSPGGPADGHVIVANPGAQDVQGSITVVPSEGDPRKVPLSVPAHSRVVVREGDVAAAPYVSALVELDAGAVVVEQAAAGPDGFSTTPCASAASERWHVADGSTARGDTMLLVLFNPFPENAIVDLSFATDQGRAVPSAFQGVVVRAGRMAVIDVGSHVRRRANVAATVSARTGRLVVQRIQLRGGDVPGMSIALAAPSPGETWYFAEGYIEDGISERFSVYNPTAREALVALDLAIERGVTAEPFELTVPPYDRVTLDATSEERVPRGIGHAVTVRSLNGVPVVAERGLVARPPAARRGVSDALGIRDSASTWVLAAGSATETIDEWVVVHNPGARPTTVSVTALAAGQPLKLAGLQDVAVPAGSRVALRLTDHVKRDDLAVVVRAATPVVVERAIYFATAPGLAVSAGIPLR